MPQYTRVLCLGDSETYGARSTHGRTYPAILEEQLSDLPTGVQSICLNRGVNGETSWQIVDRAQEYLLGDDWIKLCITMMGTNDSKPGYRTPLDLYLKQWDRLLRLCRNTGTQLIALEIHGINPIGQPEYDDQSVAWIEAMNSCLSSWCQKNGVVFIDGLYRLFHDQPELLADGIHPTNYGNQLIANRIADVLAAPLPAVSVPNLDSEFDFAVPVESGYDDPWANAKPVHTSPNGHARR